jgi:hypothetical protein
MNDEEPPLQVDVLELQAKGLTGPETGAVQDQQERLECGPPEWSVRPTKCLGLSQKVADLV